MAAGNGTSVEFEAFMPPPEGVVSRPEDPDLHVQTIVLVVAAVFPILALVSAALRLYTAKFIIGRFHLDDFFVILALIFSFAYSIIQYVQTKNGIGIHVWEVTKDQFRQFNKLGTAAAPNYFLSILFVKISVLLFYLRFPSIKAFRATVYIVLTITVGYSLAGAFGFSFLCRPISKEWDRSQEGTCVRIDLWYLSVAVLNTATDFVILLLPIWILRPLRVPVAQKIALCGILMAGGFVFGISIFRLAAIPNTRKDGDLTYRGGVNIAWCIVEMGVAIICACLPCLKALVTPLFPRLFERLTPRRNRLTLVTITTSAPDMGYLTRGGRAPAELLPSQSSSIPSPASPIEVVAQTDTSSDSESASPDGAVRAIQEKDMV